MYDETLLNILLSNILRILPFLLFLLFIVTLALLFYGLKPVFKLKCSGFKHPTVLPFFGTSLWVIRNGFQKCQKNWNRSLGQVYTVADGQTTALVISDPELIKDITIKRFNSFPNRQIILPMANKYFANSILLEQDDAWRRARRLILPTFTTSKIKNYMFPLIKTCAGVMVEHLKNDLNKVPNSEDKNGTVVLSAKSVFGCFSMDVIASTAFGLDLDSHSDKDYEFVKKAKKLLEFDITSPLFTIVGLFPFIIPFLSYAGISLSEKGGFDFFAGIIEKTIDKRKELNIKRKDYLQLLIELNEIYNKSMREENGVISKEPIDHRGCLFMDNDTLKEDNSMIMSDDTTAKNFSSMSECRDKAQMAQGLSKDEFVGNALLFFIAGYESTGNALSWAARTLAWYPEVQELIRNEISDAIRRREGEDNNTSGNEGDDTAGIFDGKGPRALTYEDIMGMSYLDQIVKEILRLHPPFTFTERIASDKYDIDGVWINKGTRIEIPIYALHRDERIWDNPDEFDPDRFSPKNSFKINPNAYMPFGQGPRNCVGLRFALLEIKVGLAFILGSNLRFVPAPNDLHKNVTADNTEFKRNAGNYPNYPLKGIDVGFKYCD